MPLVVIVQLRATGDAPILRVNKFKIASGQTFDHIQQFLRRQVPLAPSESLFLYVNSAFCPAPDEPIANLYRCHSVDGVLTVNYCLTQAWG